MVISKIERGKTLLAFDVDKVPISGNGRNIQKICEFMHRKCVAVHLIEG